MIDDSYYTLTIVILKACTYYIDEHPYSAFLEKWSYQGKDLYCIVNVLYHKIQKNKYDKYYISSFSKTSKDRVESECDYYSKCGGCHLLHMNKQE